MSEFQFPCPHCAEGVLLDESYAGEEIACPLCSGRVRVPSPSEAGHGEVAAEAGGETCPNCRAPLESEAMICVACGYNNQTGSVMSAEAPPEPTRGRHAVPATASMMPGYLGALAGGLVAMSLWIGSIVLTG